MRCWVRAAVGALGVALCLVVGSAQAQQPRQQGDGAEEDRPWYLAFGASYAYLQETGIGPEVQPRAKLDYNGGYSVGTALGYAWERTRVELAYTFSNNATGKLFTDGGFVHASGELQTNAYMVNAFYEFPELRDWYITPYVGAGLGIVSVVAAKIQVLTSTSLLAKDTIIEDRRPTFGYQLMLGTAIHLSERTSLDVGYRYFQTTGVEFHDSSQSNALLSLDPTYHHNLDIRLRIAF